MSYQQYATIGSDNGLAPNRPQTVVWTNDGLISWRIYASPAFIESTNTNMLMIGAKLAGSFGKRKTYFS